MITEQQFQALFPRAVEFVSSQAALVRKRGVPLREDQQADARLAGISSIADIRILIVPAIPEPRDPELRVAARRIGFVTDNLSGITYDHGIMVVRGQETSRELLLHELAHVRQYERLNGIEGFLAQYLRQLVSDGYHAAPLELEARDFTARICGHPGSKDKS
jgi:hypothetical protein